MAETLHRLVYYSRNLIAGDTATLSRAIDDILEVSRRNNVRANVTGALMFNAGCFGQVLEGAREDIQTTFDRIQRDPRHGNVSLLTFEPIATRSFGHWSMGFVGSGPQNVAVFAHVAQSSQFDLAHVDGDALLSALRTLTIQDEAKGQEGTAQPDLG